jgi:hypothetical protein
MNETVTRNISDGAELVNAAMSILDHWHGLTGRRGGCHGLLTEWRDPHHEADVPADCAEAVQLYDAAVAVLCRWYGIRHVASFRRYLANFVAAKEKDGP